MLDISTKEYPEFMRILAENKEEEETSKSLSRHCTGHHRIEGGVPVMLSVQSAYPVVGHRFSHLFIYNRRLDMFLYMLVTELRPAFQRFSGYFFLEKKGVWGYIHSLPH